MRTLEHLIDAILGLLEEAGIRCLEALPSGLMPRLKSPAVTVSLGSLRFPEGAMGRYLGVREDPETGPREIYGRQVEGQIRLRVASPQPGGGSGCTAVAARVVDALLTAWPAGVTLVELSQEPCRFDQATDLFLSEITAQVQLEVYVPAVEEEPDITDVVLRPREP